jgi:hypothetical protein
MIHEIGEMDGLPEGVSIERGAERLNADYVALHGRIGDARVRVRLMRWGAGPIEWDVETVGIGSGERSLAGAIMPQPSNYYSDDPAPVFG